MPFGGPATRYYISFSPINHPPRAHSSRQPGAAACKPESGLLIRVRASRLALLSGLDFGAASREGQRACPLRAHRRPSGKEASPSQKQGADGPAQHSAESSTPFAGTLGPTSRWDNDQSFLLVGFLTIS